MMIQPTIALRPAPQTICRRAFALAIAETPFTVPSRAMTLAFHPAFGNGDTPHYGL
ncbi:hypothetical protein D3C87_1915690 [compost metagenome]